VLRADVCEHELADVRQHVVREPATVVLPVEVVRPALVDPGPERVRANGERDLRWFAGGFAPVGPLLPTIGVALCIALLPGQVLRALGLPVTALFDAHPEPAVAIVDRRH